MNSTQIVTLIVAFAGGGFFTGIGALIRGWREGRAIDAEAADIGAKTPVEVESVSVTTMKTALESAQKRIEALEIERKADRDYYVGQITELQGIVKRLYTELHGVEEKLAQALRATEKSVSDITDRQHEH